MSHQAQSSILIVDDEPGVRAIFRRVVQSEGYEAIEAGSGAEGLEVAAKSADDLALIFLDLRMPEVDGFAFRNKQLGSPSLAGIPTIVVSGQIISAEELSRLQPTACIAKPAGLAQLLAAIRCHARMPPASPSDINSQAHVA